MSAPLDRLATQIFNRPHLIDGSKLNVILNVIGPRVLAGEGLPKHVSASKSDGEPLIYENGVGKLPIVGTLVRRGSYLSAASGLCSYDSIGEGVEALLADRRVKGILLEIDSPGGEASGCFDLVNDIRSMAAEAGKPIWAHANDMAFSAGYALATAGERIFLTELGEVGSVGVVATHVDVSKADAKAGHKWTYIKAGARKVDGNPHEPLSTKAEEKLQSDINQIYDKFCSLVARRRNLSIQAVKATEAGTFMGKAAITTGLADGIGTLDQVLVKFGNHLASRPVSDAAKSAQAEKPFDREAGIRHIGETMKHSGIEFDTEKMIKSGKPYEEVWNDAMDRIYLKKQKSKQQQLS